MKSEAYEILSLIERGSIGALYHARDHDSHTDVAIRRFFGAGENVDFSAKAPAYFQLTQKLLDIKHRNLLAVQDAGVDEDGPYIVHQLHQAINFQEHIGISALDERGALSLASQLLEGIEVAHGHKFYHGALHPTSVLLVPRPNRFPAVLVQDLGLHQITKLFLGAASQLVAFDPVVSAPERFLEDRETVEADLFTIGQMVYMSLVGGHPFAGNSNEEILAGHKNKDLPSLQMYREDISADFRAWIKWLINPNPGERPESAKQALAHLPVGIPTAPLTTALAGQQYPGAVVMPANRLTQALGTTTPSSVMIANKPIRSTEPIKLKAAPAPASAPTRSTLASGSRLKSAHQNAKANNVALAVVIILFLGMAALVVRILMGW